MTRMPEKFYTSIFTLVRMKSNLVIPDLFRNKQQA